MQFDKTEFISSSVAHHHESKLMRLAWESVRSVR